MNKAERALLLVWFSVVLLVLVTEVSTTFAVLGAAGGVFLGLPVARTRALRGRPSTEVARRSGVRLQRVGTTIGAHLAVIAVFILLSALVPGLKTRFVAMAAAAITAGALTVTAARFRAQ